MKFSVKLAMLVVGLVLGGIVTSVSVEAKNVVVGNHELGSFVKNDPLNRPLTRSKRSLNDLPPQIDFIDVSSNNGKISVEQYKKMKAAGVKGVVVKLTEGSKYRNTLASSQIANAKAAGLVVSTYHFSWFENQQEAIDQANYYADYAEELGLSKNSVMVNDAEASPLINADATKVSVYFRDQLEKRGFKNIVHYSSASWFNNNWMEYVVLGKENCWVAEWPASPSGNHLLHTDTAAWQWGNKGSFDFITTSTFDCNVDYLGRFTNPLPIKTQAIYRLYNPNTGEHFYTSSSYEYEMVAKAGWRKEGVAWQAPIKGQAVYRLYNPNTGEHFYTSSSYEYDMVAEAGWRKEGIAFFSNSSSGMPIYRAFNPNTTGPGSHFYTSSSYEYEMVAKAGWRKEGITFYGIK